MMSNIRRVADDAGRTGGGPDPLPDVGCRAEDGNPQEDRRGGRILPVDLPDPVLMAKRRVWATLASQQAFEKTPAPRLLAATVPAHNAVHHLFPGNDGRSVCQISMSVNRVASRTMAAKPKTTKCWRDGTRKRIDGRTTAIWTMSDRTGAIRRTGCQEIPCHLNDHVHGKIGQEGIDRRQCACQASAGGEATGRCMQLVRMPEHAHFTPIVRSQSGESPRTRSVGALGWSYQLKPWSAS